MTFHTQSAWRCYDRKQIRKILMRYSTPEWYPKTRRLSRGWGKVNKILAIIKEGPLCLWKIASGLILRRSMLINTML